nr:hypothetical protein GCM10017606_23030 [Microbacterium terregens]
MGRTPKVPITKAEYDLLRTSWITLGVIASIEEEWDSLIQNYIELELELIRSAMNTMVLSHEGYHEANQTRLGFARRLSNLLHSCKSYIDHTPHHLKKLTTAGLESAFKTATSAAYDANGSYRFMEALRNYAQHRGLPLHGATFDSGWTGSFAGGEQDKGLLRHSSYATIDLAKIRADNKFKASVMAELANSPDQLDVSILVREYMEGLAQVHENVRSSFRTELDDGSDAIRTAITQYAAVNAGDVVGLSVAEFDDAQGTATTYQNIFTDLSDRIQRLMQRNRNLVNLRLRYVSSEITLKRQEKRVTAISP